jgi:glucose/arabinose dehydrogenase
MKRFHFSAAMLGALALVCSQAVAQTVVDGSLTVTAVKTSGPNLEQPTGMVFINSNEILFTNKAVGTVKRLNVSTGAVSGTTVLDRGVNSNSERGMLGITLDPLFSTNNFVYIYYTPVQADGLGTDQGGSTPVFSNRVSRFTWNSGSGTLTNEQILIDLPVTPGANHDGGIILFGPPSDTPANQKLYIIIGDLNRNGKTQNYTAGADSDDTGVILRLDVSKDATPVVTIPSDNPFFSVVGANTSLQRQWAYGIRNSYGMDWDVFDTPQNLWTTENGPGLYDEINLVFSGYNSGWENVMGPSSRGDSVVGGGSGAYVQFGGLGTYSDPEFSFRSPVGITSLHFYRGGSLGAGYQGDLFVGDNNSGRLYKFEMNPARDGFVLSGSLADLVYDSPADAASLPDIQFGSSFGVTTSIQTGPDGHLYVLSLSLGQLYRISGPSQVTGWVVLD